MSKVIELNCATITLVDDELLEIVYKDDYTVELDDAIEVDKIYFNHAKGKRIYSIMNTQGRYSLFSSEAQEFFAKDAKLVENNYLIGNAMIIDSLANRLLARFFITFYQPVYPCKIFSNYQSARNWIEALRKQEKQIGT